MSHKASFQTRQIVAYVSVHTQTRLIQLYIVQGNNINYKYLISKLHSCNISFHQYCYGIEKIPNDDYYCDICTENMLNSTIKKQADTSQNYVCFICKLRNSPLKKLEDEWFHVTCLFTNSWGKFTVVFFYSF